MGTMHILSLILFTFLLLQFAVDPDMHLGNFSAPEDIPFECRHLVDKNYVFPFKFVDVRSVAENIDPMCLEYKKVVDCLKSVRPFVDQIVLTNLDMSLAAWSFLCTDKGKIGVQEYHQSPCSYDERIEQQIKDYVELCANTTTASTEPDSDEQSSTCSYLRNVDDCVYKVLINICGESVADYLHEMTLLVYKEVPVVRDCFLDRVVQVNGPILM